MINNFFYKRIYSNIHKSPSKISEVTSQILYGENFKILSKNKNWIKIRTLFDNYIGYIKNGDYTSGNKPTHKVFILKANIFSKPNNKTKYFLPFASKISIIQENKKFIEFEKNKWIKKKDVNKIKHREKDYLKILKLFLKTKYTWGGKTFNGIDCSAILQLFFYYNEKFFPRDTKNQIKYTKKNLKRKKFKKGDIIFWRGHVAVCINSTKLIHAYGPKKKVIIMNIKKIILEIKNNANLNIIKKRNINEY